MLCNGQLLPIDQFESLFQLIGTTYGGDGETNFALPDLQGRIPVHTATTWQLGETRGSETVNLTVNQLPAHNHTLQASGNPGGSVNPWGNVLATPRRKLYDAPSAVAAPAALSAASIGSAGNSQPHDNRQPYLCVNFIICVEGGLFPPQN
jgi:microcystin-dependent protein